MRVAEAHQLSEASYYTRQDCVEGQSVMLLHLEKRTAKVSEQRY